MTIKEGQERLAQAMLKPVNPTAIILLGVFTIVWGLWLASPFWTVFTSAPLYSFMNFVSEAVWGVIAIACGLIITHGALTRTVASLILGSRTGGIFWFVVSIMFFLGDWHNTGGITALLLAVYAFFIHLNLKVNSKVIGNCNDLFIE